MRQTSDFGCERGWLLRLGNRFLSGGGECRDLGFPSPAFHQECSASNVGGRIAGAGKAIRGDGRPNRKANDFPGLVKKLAGKKNGAEAGMDEAGGVKGRPISPVEENRQNGGAGEAGKAGGIMVPFPIRDSHGPKTNGRHFPGRKDNQNSPRLQPLDTLSQGQSIIPRRLRSAEWIHGNDVIAQPRNRGDQGVGHQEKIPPNL